MDSCFDCIARRRGGGFAFELACEGAAGGGVFFVERAVECCGEACGVELRRVDGDGAAEHSEAAGVVGLVVGEGDGDGGDAGLERGGGGADAGVVDGGGAAG